MICVQCERSAKQIHMEPHAYLLFIPQRERSDHLRASVNTLWSQSAPKAYLWCTPCGSWCRVIPRDEWPTSPTRVNPLHQKSTFWWSGHPAKILLLLLLLLLLLNFLTPQIIAKVSLSICAYLCSVFVNVLEAKAMGRSVPSFITWDNTAPTPTGDTSQANLRGRLES